MESNVVPSLKSAHNEYFKSIEQYEKDFLDKKQRLELVMFEKTFYLEKEMNSIFL